MTSEGVHRDDCAYIQDHNVITINNLVVLLVYSLHYHGVLKHTYNVFTTFLLDLLTCKDLHVLNVSSAINRADH